jgi:hypothetical protein
LFLGDLWNQRVAGGLRLQNIDSKDLVCKFFGLKILRRFERYSVGESRGMTARKAKARSRSPTGMTTRKAKAKSSGAKRKAALSAALSVAY